MFGNLRCLVGMKGFFLFHMVIICLFDFDYEGKEIRSWMLVVLRGFLVTWHGMVELIRTTWVALFPGSSLM